MWEGDQQALERELKYERVNWEVAKPSQTQIGQIKVQWRYVAKTKTIVREIHQQYQGNQWQLFDFLISIEQNIKQTYLISHRRVKSNQIA